MLIDLKDFIMVLLSSWAVMLCGQKGHRMGQHVKDGGKRHSSPPPFIKLYKAARRSVLYV